MVLFLSELAAGCETPIVSWGKIALAVFLSAAAAYLFGCFNGAVIVSKYILRDDVRKHGSGNAGLTNFYRTFGGPLTAVVILTDMLKVVFAVLLGSWLFSSVTVFDTWVPVWSILGKYWAGLFCILGHVFPCMFHFKGGKGILSGGMLAILLDWRIALIVWGGFLILVAATRYVSLGSLWAGAMFPFVSLYVYRSPSVFALALIIGGLVVWQHRTNIQRLISGTESKFSFHHKSEG